MTAEREQARGAAWVRAALQVNPFDYKGASGPRQHFEDEAAYNEALLEQCAAEDVRLLAITDHWAVDTAEALAAAATERGIVVLPGFEANTSEGIHLLVIFDAGTPFADINAAIGQCGRGITPGCQSGTTGDSFSDILTNMTRRGALVIPAHANTSPRGMLSVFSGQPLATLVKHDDLHAVAVSPGHDPAPDQEGVFAGRPPFEREHELAMVYCDDISHPDRLAESGGTTWFKMSSVGLAGLRLAVRTPETRIRRENPASRPRLLLRSLSWTGGYLDGQVVNFSDDLTALIGGRGTGKSTAIESLRYVLDLKPLGVAARRDHETVIAQVLERGTIVNLTVDAVSPVPSRYTIRRTVPDPPVVLDASGSPTDLRPQDVTGSVEIFGQHELAEVAEQPANVARLITRFSEDTPPQTLDELRARLSDNRHRLETVELEQAELEEELAEMGRLQATVAQFDQADWTDRLAAQQRLSQDEATLREARVRVDSASASVGELVEGDLVGTLRGAYEGLQDSPERELLQEAETVSRQLADTIESALNGLLEAVATADRQLEDIQLRLASASEPKRAEHAEVVRELKAEGHDPDRLIATQERLTHLAARSSQREVLASRRGTLLEERMSLLDELEEAETEARRHLGRAVTAANNATVGVVRAKPVESTDHAQLDLIVERNVANSRKALLELIARADFSPRQFVQDARSRNLSAAYGFSAAQVGAIESAGERFLRELEEVVVERAVEVSLNVADEGQPGAYKTLEALSKGQRATALLLLLLRVSKSPLIIDQPEDDLDNRFIYAGIVRHLRQLKGERQIIVSTHNANVPVLGDAELIVTLEADGQRAQVSDERTGSLDEQAVMRAAEDLLEGGHKAFDTRRHLYGF
ncbi:TrlF family AAA-like ATPase [Nocardioides aquiterrae]|uniref:AAA family ATPase n=1 Tax=Nocardioides aquiterrae TaxID=203799 RepID=A0ABN1USD0_9ACTN